jgi:hypothetical protein
MENIRRVVVHINDAATTDRTQYAMIDGAGKFRLRKIYLVSEANIAVGATHYRTISVKKDSTTLGSWTSNTGGVALTAGVPYEIPITANLGASQEIDAAALLHSVLSDATGASGLAFAGSMLLEYIQVA